MLFKKYIINTDIFSHLTEKAMNLTRHSSNPILKGYTNYYFPMNNEKDNTCTKKQISDTFENLCNKKYQIPKLHNKAFSCVTLKN